MVAGSRRGVRWRRGLPHHPHRVGGDLARGVCAPREIVERWHGEEGPADIEFVVGGRRRCVSHPKRARRLPKHRDRLGDQPPHIGHSGYHFAVCDDLGMPSWVVALKREEEDRLRGERGWSFLAL